MKATLLLGVGLLALIGTMPVSAAPVFDAAQVVSQSTINPIYMQVEGVEATCSALQEAIDLIDEVKEPSAALGRIKHSDITMSKMLHELIDEGAAGKKNKRMINADAKLKPIFHRLSSNSQELSEYAALGWDMSEKKAASKLASLGKDPSFDTMHDAINAILIGLAQVARTETVDNNEKIAIAQVGAKEAWLEVSPVTRP